MKCSSSLGDTTAAAVLASLIVAVLFSSCYAGAMTLHKFDDADRFKAVCNDGTPAGFYIRPGNTSKWVIHLAGGFWCWDTATCLSRARDAVDLTSSKNWKPTINIGGLLSSTQSLNPDFYDASAVYVPYCCSDAFSGDNEATLGGQKWQFRGKRIIDRVIATLVKSYNMQYVSKLLLSGCSAGGQAVVVNLDYVADLVRRVIHPTVDVKGLADAGWMMNIKPKRRNVAVEEQFKEAVGLWNGHPNDDCVAANVGNEWMCYISPYAMPYIRTPVLIQTEQYDQFQVSWDCCTPPFAKQDMPEVDIIRKAFQVSLQDVIKPPSAAFSPACWQHCLSEDSVVFNNITIAGTSLRQYLGDWAFSRAKPKTIVDMCQGFQCSNGCPHLE